MNTRKLLAAFLALVLTALVLIFWPSGKSAEDEVRDVLTEMALGAEEGDIGAVMDPIAEDYQDASGLRRDSLQGVLMREFLRGRRLHVVLGPIFVEIDEPHASASFEMWLAEGAEAFPLWPESSEALRGEVELERIEGDWMVLETRVSQLDGDLVRPR